jgi:hypothetical protein
MVNQSRSKRKGLEMAKKKGPKGGGSVEEQIARLEERVGAKGKKAAAEIVEQYEPDVVRLAFKRLPKAASPTTLGTRIEALLEGVPANQREAMRAALLDAKRKQSGN